MISIIICSRSLTALEEVSRNVALTVGVEYELIPIDNSEGKYSIFQAYNIGTEKSKYQMLCFMHEDISFETIDWGQKVLDAFKTNVRLGLLGVAGSSYKSVTPSGWVFETNFSEIININIVQHSKSDKKIVHMYNNPHRAMLTKVASVDGLWFCTPRDVAKSIGFDENTFSGFHCYDVDYSLSVLQKYDVAVIFGILINHFSEGSLNDSWLTETFKLHNKWKLLLPINIDGLSMQKMQQLEFEAFHSVLPKLVKNRKASSEFIRVIFNSNLASVIGLKRFMLISIVIVKKILFK